MKRLPLHQGSALILVMWALVVLTIAVFGVVEMAQLSVDHTSSREDAVEARALASTGLAFGLHPQLKKDDPLLAQTVSDAHQFKATISSEGARLNLNYVLLTHHREILENLFTKWGLSVDQADHVTECLSDWVTPGDQRSLNGAKADDYARAGLPQRPTGQPFQSFDEVRLVMNMDLLEKVRPNWQDSFTIWSSGPLNVNEAPPDLIAAVFSLDVGKVSYFTSARNGRDGIAGTSDDVPVANVNALQSALGISALAFKVLSRQVSLRDGNRRVESVGQANGTQVMISVVTRLNSSPIQYLLWSEQ